MRHVTLTLNGSNFEIALHKSLLGRLDKSPKAKTKQKTPQKTNICSGNGLVPSSNKQLPKPMLTRIWVITCRNFIWIFLRIHAPNGMLVNLICRRKYWPRIFLKCHIYVEFHLWPLLLTGMSFDSAMWIVDIELPIHSEFLRCTNKVKGNGYVIYDGYNH